MDSIARDSKVNPIECVEGGKEQLRMERNEEEETLLVPKDGDEMKEEVLIKKKMKEEVKPKVKRRVQWSDNKGNDLVEIMEFFPSDESDSDGEESNSCWCTIM